MYNQEKQTAHKQEGGGPLPSAPPPPTTPHQEQPAASGQKPPNCWGVGVLPYLIALDDVIDLPQVVTATCFVADLQQHQAYFLLSQFSHSDSVLPSLLKYTVGKKWRWGEEGIMGQDTRKRENTEINNPYTTLGWEKYFTVKFRIDSATVFTTTHKINGIFHWTILLNLNITR